MIPTSGKGRAKKLFIQMEACHLLLYATDFQQLSIRTTLGPLSLSPVIFKPIILLLSNEDNTALEASVSSSLNKDNTYIHSFVEKINKPMYTQ